MSKKPLLPEFTNEKGYFGVDHPIQMQPSVGWAPFILIDSPRQGLYVGCHQSDAKELVQFVFELKPGYLDSTRETAPPGAEISGTPVHMEFSAVHFLFAAPGETISMSAALRKTPGKSNG